MDLVFKEQLEDRYFVVGSWFFAQISTTSTSRCYLVGENDCSSEKHQPIPYLHHCMAVPLPYPCLFPRTWVELSNHFPQTNQKAE